MKLIIKEKLEPGIYEIDIPLYNRGLDDVGNGTLGIDFDNSRKQIQIIDITLMSARRMIKNIELLKEEIRSNK